MNQLQRFIEAELDRRVWTDEDIAQRMGPEPMPGFHLFIVTMCRQMDDPEMWIDLVTASYLGLALGHPANHLMALQQTQYEEVRHDDD